jgi:hypothetical protein
MGTKRTVIMVITSLLAAISLLWLQGKFEHGDERNALALVQNYKSKAGVSVPDVLSQRHPGKSIQWSAATQSSCFQHIRVHAVVAVDPAKKPLIYAFAVDINAPSIHPANDGGKAVLSALNKALARPATSGGPTASAQPQSAAQANTASASAASASAASASAASASAASAPHKSPSRP